MVLEQRRLAGLVLALQDIVDLGDGEAVAPGEVGVVVAVEGAGQGGRLLGGEVLGQPQTQHRRAMSARIGG